MSRRLSEALWVASGTGGTALGTLVGIRVLTQFLPPAAYGVLSLVLGASVLAVSLVAAPLTQAAIHYYPAVAATGSPREILQSLLRGYRRTAPWVLLVALAAAAAYIKWQQGSPVIAGLAALLLASDCWRAANLSLLNAARRHRRYVLWTFADAWGRPLVGTAAVLAFGPAPAIVLGAYVTVSAALLLVFSRRLWPQPDVAAPSRAYPPAALDARMWAYALPLLPLGLISWASSLGDRYIIAGTLGVADTGVYAAIYGFASAPFMLTGGTVELILRPAHQAAVMHGNQRRARQIMQLWIAAVACVCALGVLILAFGHHAFASLFVGKAYRQASGLMPLIGLGYAFRATSYVFERMCYAYGQTRRVLIIQLWAVAATAIATPLGVFTAGLKGAALAVPVYFSVQLLSAVVLARRTLRDVPPGVGAPAVTADAMIARA